MTSGVTDRQASLPHRGMGKLVEGGGSAPLVATGLFGVTAGLQSAGRGILREKLVRPAVMAPASPDWHTGILLLIDGRDWKMK